MEILQSCLAIVLMAAVGVPGQNVQYVSRSYTATDEPTHYYDSLPGSIYFSSLWLQCYTSSELIRIHFLEFSRQSSYDTSKYEVCESSYSLSAECEGKQHLCYMNLDTSSCPYYSQINVTFQCVPTSRVESMCRFSNHESTHEVPMYLFTPRFTESGYPGNSDCECVATPDTGSAVNIQLLFADLETLINGGCWDYIQIGSAQQMCSVNTEFDGTIINYTYLANDSVPIKFYSDKSVENKGGWMIIQPDSPGGTIQVACRENTILPSTTPPPQHVLFTGSEDVDSYSKCVEDGSINTLELNCYSYRAIHITQISLSSSPNCSMSPDCSWVPSTLIENCEGKTSGCQFDVTSEAPYYCPAINNIEISFQCIPTNRVKSMCSSSYLYLEPGQTTYISTPWFTNNYKTYDGDSQCECIITSIGSYPVTVELLFAYLEIRNEQSCHDYVSFVYDGNVQNQYCKETIANGPTKKLLTAVANSGIQFVSDDTRQGKGAWFRVNAGNGPVQMQCKSYFGLTTTTSIYNRATTYWYRYNNGTSSHSSADVSAIIVGVVGAIALLLILLGCVLCCCKKKNTGTANQRTPPQRQQRVFHVWHGRANGTAEQSTAVNTTASDTLHTPTVPTTVPPTAPPADQIRLGYAPPPSYEDTMKNAMHITSHV